MNLCYVSTSFSCRSSSSAFYKVLMANAATSALRLHQRLPRIQFTREFLGQLLSEDSCHYLFFSLIFLYVSPVILVAFPVALFAILHSASYSLTLLDVSFKFYFLIKGFNWVDMNNLINFPKFMENLLQFLCPL